MEEREKFVVKNEVRKKKQLLKEEKVSTGFWKVDKFIWIVDPTCEYCDRDEREEKYTELFNGNWFYFEDIVVLSWN